MPEIRGKGHALAHEAGWRFGGRLAAARRAFQRCVMLDPVSRNEQEGVAMAESGCSKCFLRARYDAKPRSLLGRLWRWHITWCPGWKAYMESLSDEERANTKARYGLR